MDPAERPTPVGRPPGASRQQVLRLGIAAYRAGRRVDVQEIARQAGIGRMTMYRWFGSREGFLGEVLALQGEAVLDAERAAVAGCGGEALLAAFDRMNARLGRDPALRAYLRNEGHAAMDLLTRRDGPVHPRLVARIQQQVQAEVDSGSYRPPVDAGTLAYAIVRLAEAFLYNDADAALTGDVERLLAVERAVLGLA